MRRATFLLLTAALIATDSHAATTYRLRKEREGWPRNSSSTIRVTVDGANVRADYAPGSDEMALHGSLISRDGGKTFIALNHELRTWYPLDGETAFVPRPQALITVPGRAAKKVKWSQTGEEGRLSYIIEERFQGTGINLKCTAVVRVRPAPGVARELWPATMPFTTGIADVDAQLAKNAAMLSSFPEEIVIVASKQYDGGAPSTETITLTVDEVQTLERVQPALFKTPADYVMQHPVIGVPGR